MKQAGSTRPPRLRSSELLEFAEALKPPLLNRMEINQARGIYYKVDHHKVAPEFKSTCSALLDWLKYLDVRYEIAQDPGSLVQIWGFIFPVLHHLQRRVDNVPPAVRQM